MRVAAISRHYIGWISVPDDDDYIDKYVIGSTHYTGEQDISWFSGHLRRNDTLGVRYSTSLYWAITTLVTVGYGDIVATNIMEQQYTIWIELLGTITFGYMGGVLCSNVMNSKLSPGLQEKKRKLSVIKEYLRQKGFDTTFRRTVRLYFIKRFEIKTPAEEEVLALMPPPMRRDTLKYVYNDLVQSMLLFQGLSESVTLEMLLGLQPHFVEKDGNITTQGEAGGEIWVLQSGVCHVTRDGETLGYLRKGVSAIAHPLSCL
jgi:hypothetical protein